MGEVLFARSVWILWRRDIVTFDFKRGAQTVSTRIRREESRVSCTSTQNLQNSMQIWTLETTELRGRVEELSIVHKGESRLECFASRFSLPKGPGPLLPLCRDITCKNTPVSTTSGHLQIQLRRTYSTFLSSRFAFHSQTTVLTSR